MTDERLAELRLPIHTTQGTLWNVCAGELRAIGKEDVIALIARLDAAEIGRDALRRAALSLRRERGSIVLR